MKKRIITIERQYGSGGSIIGKLVAEKMGVNYYNRSILEMASKKCGIAPDRLESAEENVPQDQWRILFLFPIKSFFWKAR